MQPSSTITLNDGTQLDSGVVKVMRAIRTVESNGDFNAVGDNGSSLGAYQWNNDNKPLQPGQLPSHFVDAAKQFGLDPTDFSPANQNKVAYAQINQYKQEGLTPNEIDALWNGAHKDLSTGQYVHNNPQRLTEFQTALAQQSSGAQQTPAIQAGTNQPAPESPPSVTGFLGNTIQSGARFVGNIGEAILHPIQTVQGLGSAAVGGLQELGGQQNDNTAAFDNLIGYFKQRYGSLNGLLHTAYTDPVGLAADISAIAGVGAGALGVAGRTLGVADAARAGDLAAQTGVRTLAQDTSVGNAATRTAASFSKLSNAINPLTAPMKGVNALTGRAGGVAEEIASQLTGLEPQTITEVINNPQQFTTDQIANTTRASIANEVKAALDERAATLDETGSAYAPIRNAETTIPVAKNFLEQQLRSVAKVDVTDGEITARGSSVVRASKDVRALQNLYDTWKPEFQKGHLTQEEFLNFRSDLAQAAKFEREFSSSKPVEGVSAKIRDNFNKTYRGNIKGLEDLDATFSSQKSELDTLRKGFIDKDGNLTSTAINKIANAAGKGKDQQLAQLEQILPGITQKLKVMKAMEDIERSAGTKVGTYPSAFLKAGGVIAGIATGRLDVVATALATTIIASPEVAVPLLRLFGNEKHLVNMVLAHLSKYATIGAVATQATRGISGTEQQTQP